MTACGNGGNGAEASEFTRHRADEVARYKNVGNGLRPERIRCNGVVSKPYNERCTALRRKERAKLFGKRLHGTRKIAVLAPPVRRDIHRDIIAHGPLDRARTLFRPHAHLRHDITAAAPPPKRHALNGIGRAARAGQFMLFEGKVCSPLVHFVLPMRHLPQNIVCHKEDFPPSIEYSKKEKKY